MGWFYTTLEPIQLTLVLHLLWEKCRIPVQVVVAEARCLVLPSKDDMPAALKLNHPSYPTMKEAVQAEARTGHPYWQRVLADVKEAVVQVM